MRAFVLIIAVCLSALNAPAQTGGFAGVAKIFAEHCLDCHAVQDPEGKLVLETIDVEIKAGVQTTRNVEMKTVDFDALIKDVTKP